MNEEAVYRTALARPGLLIIIVNDYEYNIPITLLDNPSFLTGSVFGIIKQGDWEPSLRAISPLPPGRRRYGTQRISLKCTIQYNKWYLKDPL